MLSCFSRLHHPLQAATKTKQERHRKPVLSTRAWRPRVTKIGSGSEPASHRENQQIGQTMHALTKPQGTTNRSYLAWLISVVLGSKTGLTTGAQVDTRFFLSCFVKNFFGCCLNILLLTTTTLELAGTCLPRNNHASACQFIRCATRSTITGRNKRGRGDDEVRLRSTFGDEAFLYIHRRRESHSLLTTS